MLCSSNIKYPLQKNKQNHPKPKTDVNPLKGSTVHTKKVTSVVLVLATVHKSPKVKFSAKCTAQKKLRAAPPTLQR